LKKFNSLALLSIVSLLVAGLLLAACGDATNTSAPAAATTAAGAGATTAAGAATTAAAATGGKPTVVVGSKNFTESILVAEMYALALENAGIKVQRKFDLGTVDIAHQAILKGEISIYPEYTGTAVLNVLKQPKESNDPAVMHKKMVEGYLPLKLTVLDPAPMNNTNAIAVTKEVADKYNLKNLSQLAQAASELRFAAIPDFIGPRSDTDGLGSLQKTYGGFKFKETKSYDIPLRYQALLNKQADAVVAFSTDGEIAGYNLVLLEDDKRNFPPYQFAPIVREEFLTAYPEMRAALNLATSKVTTNKISALNWKVDGPEKKDARDVAREFMKAEGVIK
jgi:osmoprotectant transport system substrate-binding protein